MNEVKRITPGSKADLARRMADRRRELIARPLAEIWEELAAVAMDGSDHAPAVPAPAPERRSWPKKGDKMRFLGCNGHDYQLEAAKKTFHPEGIYEVERFDLGDWTSYIHFVGIKGGFNSVMFDWIDAAPVPQSAASTVEPVAQAPIGYVSPRTIQALNNDANSSGYIVACAGFDTTIPLYTAPTTSPEPTEQCIHGTPLTVECGTCETDYGDNRAVYVKAALASPEPDWKQDQAETSRISRNDRGSADNA